MMPPLVACSNQLRPEIRDEGEQVNDALRIFLWTAHGAGSSGPMAGHVGRGDQGDPGHDAFGTGTVPGRLPALDRKGTARRRLRQGLSAEHDGGSASEDTATGGVRVGAHVLLLSGMSMRG